MIDIGANLGHDSFTDDLDRVMADARAVGVEQIIVTGTSVTGSKKALELAEAHPGFLWSTAGIHPHDATEFDASTPSLLQGLAASASNVAIGETGLDFHRDYSPRDTQERVFAAQLDLAIRLQKPVFLHQRDAHQAFMRILEPRLPELARVVVHCFTGTEAELEDYLKHDLFIGITGWVCDERRGLHLHELLDAIPADRLMLETDAPYLLPRTISPRPKSRRNEPANLVWVVKTVAECLGKDEKTVIAETTATAKKFFDLV